MSLKKEKPRHLGRGLQSLLSPITSAFPDSKPNVPITVIDSKFPIDKELHEALKEIDINLILPNPYQPRTDWDLKGLEELAESIRTNGVIQPVLVRKSGQYYELIAGERRYRAAKLAELKTIPSIVRKATDEQLLELALIENIHRADLNPIERAKAYKKYIDSFNLTQQQTAERLGEERSNIANYIRLLELPEEVKQMLVNGTLSMGHARAILALPTDDLKRKLANRAMAGRLNVREIERLVKSYLTNTEKTSKQLPVKPAHIADLETRLTGQLGTKVFIETRKSGHRGKIIIDFYSLDEFDRITEVLGVTTTEDV